MQSCLWWRWLPFAAGSTWHHLVVFWSRPNIISCTLIIDRSSPNCPPMTAWGPCSQCPMGHAKFLSRLAEGCWGACRPKQCVFYQTILPNCTKSVNTLRPRQNGRHFAGDAFKCIILNDNVWISIKSSLKFVPKGPINNIPSLVKIMAWRRPGDKPLSEPMMVSLLTHICVTRPEWRRHVYIFPDQHCKLFQFESNTVLSPRFTSSYICSTIWHNTMFLKWF